MIKILSLSFAFLLSTTLAGCRSTGETKPGRAGVPVNASQAEKTPTPAKIQNEKPALDVPRLVNQPATEFDAVFGKPEESRPIENGGEYRLYKIAGQSKGLAVRFYGGRAKSFNLISDESFPGSKEALGRIFNIDVGNAAPIKDAKEPLTESYRGTFGGVKFKKVSAKRQEGNKGFVFVLAEAAE